MLRMLQLALAVLPLLSATASLAQDQAWSTFNGDLKAQKYSTATQITPENVKDLKVAWQMHTGDVSDGTATSARFRLVGNAALRQRHASTSGRRSTACSRSIPTPARSSGSTTPSRR